MKTNHGHHRDIYLELVQEHPLKPIHTPAEHKAAMAVVGPMLARDHLDTDEASYLDVLTTLIEQYESKAFATVKSPVHERLRFMVEESGMTQGELGDLLGIGQSAASLILSGKRGLTTDAVKRLADYFEISAAYFI
jgi:HTH-type transcriptional regulator/antitoxin HigA